MRLVHGGKGVLVRRGLVEVQPEVELALAARARACACREGGGTVRRGSRGGLLRCLVGRSYGQPGSDGYPMGRRAMTTLKVDSLNIESLLCRRPKVVDSRPNQ